MPVSMKTVSLCVLVLQTTTLVLILRYSRTSSSVGQLYLSSTVIVISELLKLLTSLSIIYIESGCSFLLTWKVLRSEVIDQPKETVKILVPSCLYTIQNNLLFLALSNLDAATYQVTYQMKILTTAMFSVLMLGRKLTSTKWFALLLLVIGVALVQMPGKISDSTKTDSTDTDSTKPAQGSKLVGLLAVASACFSSGFAGVYFEKILKGSPQSLWIRNVQLSLLGAFSALGGVFLSDYQLVVKDGFFQGYNYITWIVIALQAFGGLVTAVVVKYADNILKGFAASLSIVFSTLLSAYLLQDFTPSSYFFVGAFTVIGSTMIYGMDMVAIQQVLS